MARTGNHSGRGSRAKIERRAKARRLALWRRIQWTVLVVIGVVALGFFLLSSAQDGPRVSGDATLGERAPEIQMTDFDGERFSLADYEGTPVVLNFWASWCPACAAEMPDFERVHQESEGRVAFIGVNQRDVRSAASDLARDTEVSYRLAEDPDGSVFDAFGGVGMPTTVFIDDSGNVIDVVTGQLTEQQLRDEIAQSLGVTV
jgi:thiol-disulfide isomerase/thioredoxin